MKTKNLKALELAGVLLEKIKTAGSDVDSIIIKRIKRTANQNSDLMGLVIINFSDGDLMYFESYLKESELEKVVQIISIMIETDYKVKTLNKAVQFIF